VGTAGRWIPVFRAPLSLPMSVPGPNPAYVHEMEVAVAHLSSLVQEVSWEILVEAAGAVGCSVLGCSQGLGRAAQAAASFREEV